MKAFEHEGHGGTRRKKSAKSNCVFESDTLAERTFAHLCALRVLRVHPGVAVLAYFSYTHID